MSFLHKNDDSFHHRMSDPALLCNNIEFSYPGVPVLTSVSFSIPYPGLSVIVGPNGGGKSTLLKIVLGLITPQAGSLEVFGTIPHRACSHVGYVPQHTTLNPDFPLTVGEAVAMGCRHQRDVAHAALDSVGMLNLANRSFAALSGGQRQRVLIARALSGGSKLLLLDEPTSAVDPAFAAQLRELVVELSQKIAILVVSHDLLFVEKRTDQILFLNHTMQTLTSEEAENGRLWELYRQHAGATHD